MKVYYINLDRSPGRQRFMERQLKAQGLDFSRVRARDGSKIRLSDVADMEKLEKWSDLLTPNAVGCALSHIDAYRRLLDSRDSHALILEDDVALLDGFAEVARDCADKMPKDSVALLYFHGDTKRFLRDNAIGLANGRSLMAAETEWSAYAGGAYVIHRDTAKRIIDYNTPVTTTSDSWGLFMKEGLVSGLYAAIPPATAPAPFVSDIGYSLKGRIARGLERLTGDRLKIGRPAPMNYEVV